MSITTSINGLDITENTTDCEIYNHLGIPSTPYVVRVPKRIPRKLKKKFATAGYQHVTPETLKLLYGI